MGSIDGVPLILAAGEATVRKAEEQISEIVKLMDEWGDTGLVNGLRVCSVEIELATIGVLSLFEARMQRHIPKGPFFKQLRERLKEADQPDLADRIHQYYLAVNVLKHGVGSSYEELRATPTLPFVVKQPEDAFFEEGDVAAPEGLVDVRADAFFNGLVETLRQTHVFLEGN